jgi:hypothetical protein
VTGRVGRPPTNPSITRIGLTRLLTSFRSVGAPGSTGSAGRLPSPGSIPTCARSPDSRSASPWTTATGDVPLDHAGPPRRGRTRHHRHAGRQGAAGPHPSSSARPGPGHRGRPGQGPPTPRGTVPPRPASRPRRSSLECTFAGLVGMVDNLAGRVELDGILAAPGVDLSSTDDRPSSAPAPWPDRWDTSGHAAPVTTAGPPPKGRTVRNARRPHTVTRWTTSRCGVGFVGARRLVAGPPYQAALALPGPEERHRPRRRPVHPVPTTGAAVETTMRRTHRCFGSRDARTADAPVRRRVRRRV